MAALRRPWTVSALLASALVVWVVLVIVGYAHTRR